MIDYFWEI